MNKIDDFDQKDSKSFWKSINSLRHSKNKSVNPISLSIRSGPLLFPDFNLLIDLPFLISLQLKG
jgi:hypothetical protein